MGITSRGEQSREGLRRLEEKLPTMSVAGRTDSGGLEIAQAPADRQERV
ncbi:MAG: hypothetical protein ACYSWP_08595 [Planctomycetota bacterium]